MFSKIFEKTIYYRIYYYLVKHNLIFDKLFGFRSNYSTSHAVLSITERTREHIDSGSYVYGVFVDTVFVDTVNHTILYEKLNYYELRGNVNRLIQSYLANRKRYVSIYDFESDIKRYFVWSSSGIFIRAVVIFYIQSPIEVKGACQSPHHFSLKKVKRMDKTDTPNIRKYSSALESTLTPLF